jgi:hypothetical protein
MTLKDYLKELFTNYSGVKGPLKLAFFLSIGFILVVGIYCQFVTCSGITRGGGQILQAIWFTAVFVSAYRSTF